MSRTKPGKHITSRFRACRVPSICSSCQRLMPVGEWRFYSKPTGSSAINLCVSCNERIKAEFKEGESDVY